MPKAPSASAPKNLYLWVGRPLGPDPLAHYWYQIERKHWVRLCDGLAWLVAFDPSNDFRMPFPAGCWNCGNILQDDELWGQKRLKFRKDSPRDWRETYEPWAYDDEDELTEADSISSKPRALMTQLLNVNEATTEAEQRELIEGATLPKIDYQKSDQRNREAPQTRGFRQCVRISSLEDMTRDKVKQCLENWVHHGGLGGPQARGMVDAFWRELDEQGFSFVKAPWPDVLVSGLAVRVTADIVLAEKSGKNILVKLWVEKNEMSERRRQATLALLDESRKIRLIAESHVAVWEVGRRPLEGLRQVPDDFGSALRATAGLYREMLVGS